MGMGMGDEKIIQFKIFEKEKENLDGPWMAMLVL